MRKSSESGFTLVELMTVVMIMAVMITIGVTSLPKLSRSIAVNRGASHIVNAMSYARQMAITTHSHARVVFKDADKCGVFITNLYYASSRATGAGATWLVTEAYGGYLGYAGRQEKFSLPAGARMLFSQDVPGSVKRFPLPNRVGSNFGGTGEPVLILHASSSYMTVPTNGTVSGASTNLASFGEKFGTSGPWGDSWQGEPHAWITFDKFGRADISATVTVVEVSSSTGEADPNSKNRVQIITQAGTDRVQVIRN
jgi:prepilin-type N-terminal cleavage/methylation domain-containing protein